MKEEALDDNILQNLLKFDNKNKLNLAFMTFIAGSMMSVLEKGAFVS